MPDVYEGLGFDVQVPATENLSTHIDKVVSIGGTIALNSSVAFGVLKNKPRAGEMAQVKMLGIARGYAAAAISANALLKVTSGYFITVASGDNSIPAGKNISGSVNSGDLFTAAVNFINAGVVLPSSA